MMKHKYYAERNESGLLELRQERFRQRRANGREHPHDICAVARTVTELRDMEQRYLTGGIDYSAVVGAEDNQLPAISKRGD